MEDQKTNIKLCAAIYIRVSTDDQKKGYSPEFQLEDCKRVAIERDNCTIKDEHIFDDSKSGSNDDRPGWKKLMAVAKRREIGVVYFWKLDRMMRSERHFYRNEEELENLGIQLRFATQNLDDPFTRAIQVAVAAEERRKIVERTQRGRKMAARSGKWIWGPPPYGYELDPETKKLKIVPEEAKWVNTFFQWAVKERLPLTAIQRRANALKVPCYGKRRRRKTELEGFWHKRSIARILSNPTYTGTAYFFRFKRGFVDLTTLLDKKLQCDENQWITMKVPSIITQKLFDQCQDQRRRNREMASRNLKHAYLFNKLVHCGKCGLKLYARVKLPKKSSWNLHKHYQGPRLPKWRKVILDDSRCHYCGDISESRLEPIWNDIRDLLENPTYMFSELDRRTKGPASSNDTKGKLEEAEKRVKAILRKKQKIDHVYLESDSMDYPSYKKKLMECKREEDEIRREIVALRQRILQEEKIEDNVESIKQLYEKLRDTLNNTSYENKSKIIHLLVNKITLYKDKNEVEVELNIPNHDSIESQFLFSSEESKVKLCDNRQDVGHPIATFIFKVKLADLKEQRREILSRNRTKLAA